MLDTRLQVLPRIAVQRTVAKAPSNVRFGADPEPPAPAPPPPPPRSFLGANLDASFANQKEASLFVESLMHVYSASDTHMFGALKDQATAELKGALATKEPKLNVILTDGLNPASPPGDKLLAARVLPAMTNQRVKAAYLVAFTKTYKDKRDLTKMAAEAVQTFPLPPKPSGYWKSQPKNFLREALRGFFLLEFPNNRDIRKAIGN
jgi:hypothetical protein